MIRNMPHARWELGRVRVQATFATHPRRPPIVHHKELVSQVS
eukprot:CAMPEP_0169297864 /NCGR_PEP_ID=MMETSP1016-20121227/66030_1 /TAXON_ID=342587 /ORGANISM="Karlodinium micrum, Strain CCMP2283" /LENGTH=41 /DNA_ID= /DNA_START= /DNA_END= /DNA_ORIENTATION=